MLKREAGFFLVIGSTAVLLDFACYQFLLKFAVFEVHGAKASGFISAMIFSFVANKNITFRHVKVGDNSWARFCIVYLISLVINVKTNAFIFEYLNKSLSAELIAFLTATAFSAFFNFLGMKFYTFKIKKY